MLIASEYDARRQSASQESQTLIDSKVPALIGRSVAFGRVMALVARIARCAAPVLIEGETGTGKDLVARAIHYGGQRQDKPFLPVNCGAIPEALFESQLFGHQRGAFTDAKEDQRGLIELAEGGTLFLDEVEALAPRSQAALLRFLQDRRYRPLGARIEREADVRIITASNTELQLLMGEKAFRSDLFYRLNVLQVQLPPLRERHGDVQLLVTHFVERYGEHARNKTRCFDDASLAWFDAYPWPGNIRELENLVYRCVLLSENEVMSVSDFNAPIAQDRRRLPDRRWPLRPGTSLQAAKQEVLHAFEYRYLEWALTQTNGNITHAAALAQTERRALGKLLQKHRIDAGRFR